MVSREDFRSLVSSSVWLMSATEKYVLLAMGFLPTLPFQEMYCFPWLDHYTFLLSNTNWHLLMGITVILQVWFKGEMKPDPCAIATQWKLSSLCFSIYKLHVHWVMKLVPLYEFYCTFVKNHQHDQNMLTTHFKNGILRTVRKVKPVLTVHVPSCLWNWKMISAHWY